MGEMEHGTRPEAPAVSARGGQSPAPPKNSFLVVGFLALLGFALLFVSIASKGVFHNMAAQMDNALYGQFLATQMRLRERTPPAPSDVVIVGIDDRTLNKLGAYSPDTYRAYHVLALEYLLSAKPRAVVYDILFTDPHPVPEVDARLAGAMKKGTVLMAHFATATDASQGMFASEAYPALGRQAIQALPVPRASPHRRPASAPWARAVRGSCPP